MIKKLLILMLLSLPLKATTFTLNLSKPGGSTTYTNTSVVFQLKNYGSSTPFMVGSFVIVPTKETFYPNNAGLVTGALIGNDVITPNNTYYTMQFYNAGNQYYTCNVKLTGSSVNLNNNPCIPNGNLPPALPPDLNFFDSGAFIANQPGINIIPGTNVTISVVNDPTNKTVDVTFNATGGSGSGIVVQTNSTPNILQTLLNFNTSVTNSVGLTATPINTSGGVELIEITGNNYTGNAATANALATTPNQCTGTQFAQGIMANGNANCATPSGSGGSSPTLSTNTVNNTSQSLLDFHTSTANVTGLTVVPHNPSGGIELFEITGSSFSGNAATATLAAALSGTPTQCTGTQFAQGIAANGNANCATVPSAGSGITVVGGGSLFATAIMTGGGTTTAQTPNTSTILDSSGNLKTGGNILPAGPIPYIDAHAPPYNCAGDGTTNDTTCIIAIINALNASPWVSTVYFGGAFEFDDTASGSAPVLPFLSRRGIVFDGSHGDRSGGANGGGSALHYHYSGRAANTIQLGNPKTLAVPTASRNSGTSMVTGTFTTPPAGSGTFQALGLINVTGCADSSYNTGPLTINSVNYGTNTVVWGQTGASSSTTGCVITAPLHDTHAGYDGIQGLEFKNLEFSCVGGTTALSNGTGNYCGNAIAIADYRGGSVRIINSQFENWKTWFWGNQSDNDTFTNVTTLYNEVGQDMTPDSDQYHQVGTQYSLYDDTVFRGSGIHGAEFDYVNVVDTGTSIGCPFQFGDMYNSTPGDPNDNSNPTVQVQFNFIWYEHSGNPPNTLNCVISWGDYNGVPNNIQFSNQYNTGLHVGMMKFKTRPQGSASTTYGIEVGNGDFVYWERPINAYLGVSPTGSFQSWFNFVGTSSQPNPQNIFLEEFDTGTSKATTPPTLFTNSGTGTPVVCEEVINNGVMSFTAGCKIVFGGSTTSAASFNIPSGTLPTSPVLGDCADVSGTFECYNGSIWVALGGSSGIANTTTTFGSTTIAGNTCTSATTVSMTGVVSGTTFNFTATADASGITGWGSSGGLTVVAWPTSNTLNYKVCNQTTSSIGPTGAITFNVSAK